ncbi:unnamed protein product [Lactuca saligna]|uniref:Uncharacterized protein n=1 Tax=Lactuca saligna TaxID=75948 RepID=A0AA35VDH1_LACSI|nr:unnamed protein product [Lactuca saligna]
MEEFGEDIRFWYVVPSIANTYEIRNSFQSYGVNLPTVRRMSGRPNVKRRRHDYEHEDKYHQVSYKGRTVHCKNGLQRGHNKTACKNLKKRIGDRGGNRGGGSGSGGRSNRVGDRGSGGRGKIGGVWDVVEELLDFLVITIETVSESQPSGAKVMDQEGMGEEDIDQHDMGEDDMDQHDMGLEVMDHEGMDQEDMNNDGINADGRGIHGMAQEGINKYDMGIEGMDQEALGVEDMHQEDNRRRMPKMRIRKPSERITEIQLKKVVIVKNRKGVSSSNPLSLD